MFLKTWIFLLSLTSQHHRLSTHLFATLDIQRPLEFDSLFLSLYTAARSGPTARRRSPWIFYRAALSMENTSTADACAGKPLPLLRCDSQHGSITAFSHTSCATSFDAQGFGQDRRKGRNDDNLELAIYFRWSLMEFSLTCPCRCCYWQCVMVGAMRDWAQAFHATLCYACILQHHTTLARTFESMCLVCRA